MILPLRVLHGDSALRAGFLSVVSKSTETALCARVFCRSCLNHKKQAKSALETLECTGLFEGVEVFKDRDCSNPTVRRQISGSTTDLGPSGLRRQFQVAVSFFCIFFVRRCPVRRTPTFLRPTAGPARYVIRTRRLLSPSGVSTQSRTTCADAIGP